MARAIWNGTVLAESDDYEVVEGNIYFPPDSISKDHFHKSPTETICSWKGTASYYDIVVNGDVNEGAAWYYAAPLEDAGNIRGYVAFWRGVDVER